MPRKNNRFPEISAGCYIGAALLLMVLPLRLLVAAVIAAGFHELCHYLAIRALGGQVLGIRVGTGGIVMDISPMSPGRELVCALAGPAGSAVLVLCARWMPAVALCAAVQGLFNLLPVFPLDGGRAVHRALGMLFPKFGHMAAAWIEKITLLGVLLLSLWLCIGAGMGLLPLAAGLLLAGKAVLRKIPCKEARVGVQ